MDFDELTLHAQKHIEDHGYVQYAIGAMSHAEGTNVWEVDAEAGEETLSPMIDDADGSLMNLDKHRNVQVNLTDQIHVHDSISVALSMYFELISKQRLDSININLKSIELISGDDNFLTAFRIRLPQSNIADYARAYKLANQFVNYLSVVVGIPISHKRPLLSSGKSVTIAPLPMTIDIARKRGLDEDLLLNMTEPSANAFYYFANGHDAFQNNRFDQAIGWFYKIIEDKSLTTESEKYAPLRHVVSHKRLDSTCAIDALQQTFSLSVNSTGYLDFNSPDVQFKLYLACRDLHEVVKQKIIGIVNE